MLIRLDIDLADLFPHLVEANGKFGEKLEKPLQHPVERDVVQLVSVRRSLIAPKISAAYVGMGAGKPNLFVECQRMQIYLCD